MPVRVLLESQIKSGNRDQVIAFITENLAYVRSFKGCTQVNVLFDKEQRAMLFDEVWLTPYHHQCYLEDIAQSGVMETLVSHLEAPPTIKYLYASTL